MAERVHDFLGAPHALRTIPGFYAPRPGIQIGCSIAHDATDDHLQLLQQLGVDWAHINVNDAALHNVEGYVGDDRVQIATVLFQVHCSGECKSSGGVRCLRCSHLLVRTCLQDAHN